MRRRPLRYRSRDEQNAAFANMRSSGTYVRSRHNGHRHVTRRVYQRRQPVERVIKVKPVEKKVIAPKKDPYAEITKDIHHRKFTEKEEKAWRRQELKDRRHERAERIKEHTHKVTQVEYPTG